MQYRILGDTGLKVSALSFGCAPLGGAYGDKSETDGIRAVEVALELGINFFDVSPFYGLTRAESILGRALNGVPRDSYYLATKVGRYGEKDFDFSERRVMASIEESLERLNVDYVDVLQCHDIEFASLDQIVSETIPALRKIQAQGKARFIGITGLPLKIFNYVLDRCHVDTMLAYCHYCLIDTSLSELLPYLQAKQVGIINASPFAMGLLTERGAPHWHPASEQIKSLCEAAVRHCRSKGNDIAQVALTFSMANPNIATTLVGMAHPNEVRKNVAWSNQPIDQELLSDVEDILLPIRSKPDERHQ